MTPQTEFFDKLLDTVEKNCILDSRVSTKELSDKNSLYAELGDGFTETTYFDKTEVKTIPVLFLSRHKDQQRCLEQLCDISNYLQRLKAYPQGELFKWLDCETAKQPSKIGRDEDGTYHYSCIVNCKIYF